MIFKINIDKDRKNRIKEKKVRKLFGVNKEKA